MSKPRHPSEAIVYRGDDPQEYIVQLERDLAAAQGIIDAARELVLETRYVTGMHDDNPHKGSGNRLAEAMLVYDAAIKEQK